MRESDYDEQRQLDEVLGVVRCARCGHRLDGHVDCPFCAVVEPMTKRSGLPLWIFLTACIITSPLGLIGIISTDRLGVAGKLAASAVSLLWSVLVIGYFF